ncbi:MAG: S8 family serine peptidase [Burkholderiaceae bacterium]|nr:S8 family serine peptidase [Burkholderiaceae bacterium]
MVHHACRSIRFTSALATLAASIALGACGGGGGGASTNASNAGFGDDTKEDIGSWTTLRDYMPPQAGCRYLYSSSPPVQGRGADPLRNAEWHLTGLAAPGAGDSARGEGVRIAVVDGAIEAVHEDLFPNLVAWRNYRADTRSDTLPLPCEPAETHGTAVAGIVAARDGNGLGVAGVAPRASLATYNPLVTNTEADLVDALRRGGAITGVYNNSWGAPDSTGILTSSGRAFANAILDGIASGRGGLGSIYVFPAGNGCALDPLHCGLDDSNFDGYANARGVITACGVDADERKPWYAEPGANILVCGFSGGSRGIVTADVENRYRQDFGGTSASAPMISGVVALMLEASPSLTWRDVRLILASSARRNDAGDAGWRTNGAGLFVHPYYGFGIADAQQAVARAKTWASVGGSASLRSCEYRRAPAASLRDGKTVADAIDARSCPITAIELVEVGLWATHPSSGDLRVVLGRDDPASPPATLAHSRVCRDPEKADTPPTPCGDYQGWVFRSVRNLNETSQDQWTLSVSDELAGSEGTWDSWTLTIWGR